MVLKSITKHTEILYQHFLQQRLGVIVLQKREKSSNKLVKERNKSNGLTVLITHRRTHAPGNVMTADWSGFSVRNSQFIVFPLDGITKA